MTPLICSDPVVLDQLRFLLGLGLVAMAGVLLFDYIYYATRPKKAERPTYCPLHRTDRSQCEDKHRDD